MIRLRHFFVFLLLVILAASCTGPHIKVTLDKAESILNDSPDSVLVLLRQLEKRPMLMPWTKARYSLIYAASLDKNYIDTADIQVVMPAVQYYRYIGNEKRLMKAYYYQGVIYNNGGDKEAAVISWLKADNLVQKQKSNDNYFMGLLYTRLGISFNDSYNNAEALTYHKKAHDAFVAAGKEEYARWSSFSIAQELNNLHYFDSADSLYGEVTKGRDDIVAFNALTGSMHTLIVKPNPDYKKAVEQFRRAKCLNGFEASEDEVWEYAFALMMSGDNSLADSLLTLPESGDFLVHAWKYEICKAKGDYKNALLSLEKNVFNGQDSIVLAQLKQSYLKVQRDFYHSEYVIEQKKSTELKYVSVLITFVFLFILSAVIALWTIFKRKKEQEISLMVTASDEAQRLLGEAVANSNVLDDSLNKLKMSFFSLYRRQFEELGKLFEPSNTLSYEQMAEKYSRETLARYKTIISEIRGKESSQRKLEQMVDAEVDNIISKLRSDFPQIKDREILLACYIVMGFDATTISCITGETQNNVRVRKSRLKGIIFSKETRNSELYRLAIK